MQTPAEAKGAHFICSLFFSLFGLLLDHRVLSFVDTASSIITTDCRWIKFKQHSQSDSMCPGTSYRLLPLTLHLLTSFCRNWAHVSRACTRTSKNCRISESRKTSNQLYVWCQLDLNLVKIHSFRHQFFTAFFTATSTDPTRIPKCLTHCTNMDSLSLH